MTESAQDRPLNKSDIVWIEQGQHRAHPQIADVLIFFALLYKAFDRRAGARPIANPVLSWSCYAANLSIRFALIGMMDALQTGDPPKTIGLVMVPKEEGPPGENIYGAKSVLAGVISSAFALFAERAIGWVRENVSTDYHQWPVVTNFSRVVRNAIVHGGTINISSKDAPTVSWRGVTLTYENLGVPILSPSAIGPGDLMMLMLDLEEELNTLGAPFDLG